MAIFSDLKPTKKQEVDLDTLKRQLSPNQLKVAKQNYRVIIQQMSQYMDISCIELQLKVSRRRDRTTISISNVRKTHGYNRNDTIRNRRRIR